MYTIVGAVVTSAVVLFLVKKMFVCSHKNYSFPQTAKRGEHHSKEKSATGKYVSCLDCGKTLAYDWQKMKVLSRREVKKYVGNSPVTTDC